MAQDADTLSQMLSPMRVTGSVLLAERYTAPWGIAIPDATTFAQMMDIGSAARVVVFHVASEGTFDFISEEAQRTVAPGEIVLCVGGMSHTVSQGQAQAVSLQTVMAGEHPFRAVGQASQPGASVVSGAFLLQNTQLNPLFVALPRQLHITVFDATRQTPANTVAELFMAEIMQRRQGRQYAIERYLELLCIETIRTYMAADLKDAQGWFRGMQDPLIQTTLAYIHEHADETLSVSQLADHVNLSPSRFAARFRDAMQESPMAYVASWRLYRASYLLKQPKLGVEDVAVQVGYHDFTAFGRAFKRRFGQSPTTWRALALSGSSQSVA